MPVTNRKAGAYVILTSPANHSVRFLFVDNIIKIKLIKIQNILCLKSRVLDFRKYNVPAKNNRESNKQYIYGFIKSPHSYLG